MASERSLNIWSEATRLLHFLGLRPLPAKFNCALHLRPDSISYATLTAKRNEDVCAK